MPWNWNKEIDENNLHERIALEFPGTTVVREPALNEYRNGMADGDMEVVIRLSSDFPINDLRFMNANFIFFAERFGAEKVFGGYLLCCTQLGHVVTGGEDRECFADCLFASLGALERRNEDGILTAYGWMSMSQAATTALCLHYVVNKQLPLWEDAQIALEKCWARFLKLV